MSKAICSVKTPGCTYLGINATEKISGILEKENAKKVIVLTDRGVYDTGLCTRVLEQLNGAAYHLYTDIKREPSYLDVEDVVQTIEDLQCDIIVAVGGGSVMDTAKLCSVLKNAPYSIKDLLRDPALAHKQIKTVFLPTTCGTGSEATCNAIVAIPEESVKKGIVNDEMIPDYAILDPEMIRHLPPAIVAATGVDALAHAVECYTSLKATPLSDLYAREGARLIFHNIVKAYRDPEDMDAKKAMLLAAYYGGIAITASGTTAVHALSYPLGGKFHIAHGISNAILFSPVMKVNRSACAQEMAQLCDTVFPEQRTGTIEQRSLYLLHAIEQVIRDTDIPTNLKQYGVKGSDLDFLVEAGGQQRRLLDNNRKELTIEEIRNIYLSVLPEDEK